VIHLTRIPYQQDYLCGDCAHYTPHYVKIDGVYHSIHQGHCTFPRVKPRCDNETCPRWAPIPTHPAEKDPVSP